MADGTTYFYNTMTGKKEIFIPMEKGKVKMYTCGPTVYDNAHIGNFRTFIFEDLLRRYLKLKGYEVFQVMNITDVDDKTIRNAIAEKRSISEYTQKYIKMFFDDLDRLRIERAEVYPKATEHIGEMIALIKRLGDKGFIYEKDGSTYFRIKDFKSYGKLSNIDFSNVRSGSRYDTDEYEKEDVRDFVLWKKTDPESGEPTWDSPFGKGRPGWHIECSAMSMKYLGETFDIHTGGVDNIFPHHENEIAQTEAATEKTFVKYWLHCEHLLVENSKMSKSAGNFYTLRDLEEYDMLAVRYLLLSAHYRAQLNFTIDGLKQAEATIRNFNEFRERFEQYEPSKEEDRGLQEFIDKTKKDFIAALDDDLNISKALGFIFIAIRELNMKMNKNEMCRKGREKAQHFFDMVDSILDIRVKKELDVDPTEVERLLEERNRCRKERDFVRADEIRNILQDRNIVINDGKEKTTWYVKS